MSLPKADVSHPQIPFRFKRVLDSFACWSALKKRALRAFPRRAPIWLRRMPQLMGQRCLVGRAFGNEDKLDSAIFLLRAFLRRGLTGPRAAARSVNALFSQVSLRQVRALLRELG